MKLEKVFVFMFVLAILLPNLEVITNAEVYSNYIVSSDKTGVEEIGSLEHALINAESGDTITLNDGIYDVSKTTEMGKGSFFVVKKDNITIKTKTPDSTVIIQGLTTADLAYDGGDISYEDTILILGNNVTLDNITVLPLIDNNNKISKIKNAVRVSDFSFAGKTGNITAFEMKKCIVRPNDLDKDYGGKVYLDIKSNINAGGILLTNNTFNKTVVEVHNPSTLNKNTFIGKTTGDVSILVKQQDVMSTGTYDLFLTDNKFNSIPAAQKVLHVTSAAKITMTDNTVNNAVIASSLDSFIGNPANAVIVLLNSAYSVKFYTNGGNAIADQTIALGNIVAEPSKPTKNGYEFAGWYLDSGLTNPFHFAIPIVSDTILYAKWTEVVQSLTVTFQTNSGTNISSQTIVSGSLATEPSAPQKTGYHFMGWYMDSAFSTPFDFNTAITSDITLYAKWEADVDNVTVTFHSNGGSNVNAQTIARGSKINAPSNPTKTDRVFSGWYSDTGLTNLYNFNNNVTNDLDLYAKWEEPMNNVTISFISNGGTSVAMKTIKSGEAVTAPTNPSKAGYTFVGWYTDTALNTQYNFNAKVTSNLTLYAKWSVTVTDLTVNFNSNGGTNVTSKIVKAGETITTPINPAKTGYSFAGWYTDTALTNAYRFNTKVTTNLTLYAKWSLLSNYHTVAFNSNGGSDVATIATKWSSTISLPANPTKTDYTFVGWYTDKSLTQKFDSNSQIKSNITLYAKWTNSNNTVGISFDSNGGNYVDTIYGVYNESVSQPNTPSKSGHIFGGWYRDRSLTQPYNFSDKVTYHMTLYAKWISAKDAVTVYFESNGGTKINSIALQNGEKVNTPTKPTKPGYIFDSWYTNSSLTEAYNFNNTVTRNITLYARWVSEKDVYVVSFRSNGGNYVNPVNAYYGKTIKQPDSPQREAYIFEGWYTDEALTKRFDFSTAIKSDTTLYAKWSSNRYTVTFDSRGGGYVAPRTTTNDGKITTPSNPVFNGYRFIGWYKDTSFVNQFNFSEVIKSNITLYAKWELIPTTTPVTPIPTPTPPPVQTTTYSDVKSTHWANKAIKSLTEKSILTGTGGSKFEPDKELTRAEFAVILTKTFGLNEKTGAISFTDVKENAWYRQYVRVVTSNNIYVGYEDGSFKPNQPINREEMAVVIYRVLQLKGSSVPQIRTDNVADLNTAKFGKEAITELYRMGIVNGMADKKYMPAKKSTRAEASMVIYNLINRL